MFTKMVDKLNEISFIPYEEVAKISPYVKSIRLRKGELFVRPGDKHRKITFISQGLLKNFYTTNDGREYISNFYLEGDFLCPYFEITSGKSSIRYIQALEDSEVLSINYDDLSKVNSTSIFWAELIRKMSEKKMAAKEDKERDLMLFGAEYRYMKFITEKHELANRLPQNQVALYLGINPSTLSRLKKKAS